MDAYPSSPEPENERRRHALLLSRARSGLLPAAIRESRRLERRARWRRLLLANGVRAGTVPGAS